MDVREKLVEICFHEFCMVAGDSPCGCDGCPYGKYGSDDGECYEEYKKDKMAKLEKAGVTVQEWISVKDRLPQEDEPESTLCEQVQVILDNGFVSTGWCNRNFKMWWHLNPGETRFIGFEYDHTPVIAWQPLAQPPKGE